MVYQLDYGFHIMSITYVTLNIKLLDISRKLLEVKTSIKLIK